MIIRLAKAEDLNEVMSIVAHTIRSMAEMSNDQWDSTYPKEDRFLTDISQGSLYVAQEDEQKIAAFITIDEEQAAEYSAIPWQGTNPIILHRLAVHPNAQGAGLAKQLEQFTCSLAKQAGKDSVRLDTYSTNIPMQSFLTKRGYTKVGEMDYRGKSRPFFCYEKLFAGVV